MKPPSSRLASARELYLDVPQSFETGYTSFADSFFNEKF